MKQGRSLRGRGVLVTGCAGFIGSHLSERLVEEGAAVRGIDSFSGYYDRALKEANLRGLSGCDRFELREADLVDCDLRSALDGVDVIFHQAGQPGVRGSWGSQFSVYVRNNIEATQHLLEAALGAGVPRIVLASSSSVYGDAASFPTSENVVLAPVSPYGATKAAAEHLALLYGKQHDIEVIALRYFTVYGPRQRPDMAFTRFLLALERGEPIGLYGDGSQSRDFTFVSDALEANLAAATVERAHGVYNIGGGSVVRLSEVLESLTDLTGVEPVIERFAKARGDVRSTSADTSRARVELGYSPRVQLYEGLRHQLEWIRDGQKSGAVQHLRAGVAPQPPAALASG